MLSYFRFLLLSLDEKKQYLIEKGNFLLSHPDEKGKVSLYALNDFFVEMHEDEESQVTQIMSFKGSDRLEQHARHIHLTELNIY